MYSHEGMIGVDEKLFDTLLVASGLTIEDIQELNLQAASSLKEIDQKQIKGWLPGEKDLYNTIVDSITEQLSTAADELKKQAENKEITTDAVLKSDFFDKIESSIKDIVNDNTSTVGEHLESIYKAGKAVGFKQLDVTSFFGPGDKQALFFVKNYNFDLVKNASNDLTSAIREKIWRGAARGDTIPTITKEINKLNITPIKAGNRLITPEERARMIARTETMRATNTGTLMSYKNYGVNLVDIVGGECSDCIAIQEAGPYDINEGPEDGWPPFHPNCTDTVAPHVEAAYSEAQDVPLDEVVDLTIQNT